MFVDKCREPGSAAALRTTDGAEMTSTGDGPSGGEHDHVQFALSLGSSNFNAIVSLTIFLAKAGLMTPDDVQAVHATMSDPLDLPGVSENRLVAIQQSRIDAFLGEIDAYIAKR